MTTASSRKYDDGGTSPPHADPPDDASDITPTDDRNSSGKERTRVEKTLRFRFAHNNSNDDTVTPCHIHFHWVTAVQEAFGDQVRIIDNNNRVLPKVDLLRWTTLQHQQHYKIHQQNPNDSKRQSTVYYSSNSNKHFIARDKSHSQNSTDFGRKLMLLE
jgi:hypothetical protein